MFTTGKAYSMRSIKLPFIAIAAALLLIVALTGMAAAAAHADAPCYGRPVTLAQASMPPSELVYLLPGQGLAGTPHATNVSAYAWDGDSLGCQRSYPRAHSYVWRMPDGDQSTGAVRYNWATHRFLNSSDVPVLVATWTR
jgi:hypothetical protein